MTKKKLNFQDIEALVHQGESDTLEFKKSTAELHSAGKTLCGLLNRNGGNVLIGVTDNKHIVGQDVSDQTQQEIANLIKKIEPAPMIAIDYVQINNSSRRVIILTVYHDENAKPYTFEGKAFDRIASGTFSMPQERYHRLLLETTQKNKGWEDGIAKDVTLDHLDQEEILKTIQEGISKHSMQVPQVVTEDLSAFKLKPRQKEILKLLSSGKKMSVSEIHSQLLEQPSMRTVKGDLALLQKQKLVEPVGKGRTTMWIIRS